jgi:hypothetical protein
MALLDWADRRVIEARHNWIMQQQLSNHFLLRRLITPQWKLLLDNFRFIPPVVELRNKDFFFLFQTRHEFWNTTPLQEILRSSAEIQRMWASDGMVPRRKEHSSKTAQGFASRWATPFSMKMTTQQQWNNKILPGPRWSICSESTKQPPPVLDIHAIGWTKLRDSEEPGRADLQQPLVVRHVIVCCCFEL